jgi:hypothetical protein
MRINLKDTDAVRAALAAVNGKAERHAYTLPSEIAAVADDAERQLARLDVPKAARKGARYVSQSGQGLPKAYKYSAIGTVVTLERGASAWFLVYVGACDIWPGKAPITRLTLTPDQDAAAVAALRKAYAVGGI